MLKDKHAGGCTLDPKYKKQDGPPASSAADKRVLQYARAMMTAMDLGADDGDNDATEDENL